MVFAGGAFALGMLAVRFLRSKSRPTAGSGTSGWNPSGADPYRANAYGYASSTTSTTPNERPYWDWHDAGIDYDTARGFQRRRTRYPESPDRAHSPKLAVHQEPGGCYTERGDARGGKRHERHERHATAWALDGVTTCFAVRDSADG